MSAQRPLSDVSATDSGQDDDEILDAAFGEFEEQNTRDIFDSSASMSSPTSNPARQNINGHRSNATRMLEALEALSHDTDSDDVPQSLQGLLEQLHSGDSSILDGVFPFSQLLQSSGSSSRFQRIYEQIGTEQPIHTQIEALTELCETLSLSSEEALEVSGFSVEKFVSAIVALLRISPSMELLLLAARALSTILELFPSIAISKAAAEHVIPSLCEKLLEIEYMDVAELALQILETIVCKTEFAFASVVTVPNVSQLCAQYRTEVINENGIVALLQFVDFFQLEIQRRAVRIVCQLCTEFPSSLQDKLRQGLPFITNLLRSFDPEILQSSFECLQKLADSSAFSTNPEFASMVATDEICDLLVAKLMSFVSLNEPGGSPVSHFSPLSILRFLSCYLSCVASDLRDENFTSTASQLRYVRLPPIATALLAKKEVIADSQVLGETLKLALVLVSKAEMLLPTDKVPRPVLMLAQNIMPSLIRVYDTTSRTDLRHDCLNIMYQGCLLVHANKQSTATSESIENSRLAAFLARVLRPKRDKTIPAALANDETELAIVIMALRIIEVPLQHIGTQEAAKDNFERHGVANIIRMYATFKKEDNTSDCDEGEAIILSTRLVNEFFGAESLNVSMLNQLRQLVTNLQSALSEDRQSEGVEKKSLCLLRMLRDFVAQGDMFLTAYELASSGLVKVLIEVLIDKGGQRAFCQMLNDPGNKGMDFIMSLLQCLQDAISSEKDAFPVSQNDELSAYTGLSSGSIVTDLDQLLQHIKVHVLVEESKPEAEPDHEDNSMQGTGAQEQQANHWKQTVERDSDKSSYRSVHNTIVLVEPLARIETMEDFIADKLFGQSGSGEPILDVLTRSSTEVEEREDIGESGEFANDTNKLRRVVAVYNKHVLPADISLLEAIVKFRDVAETTLSASRSRIWRSTPHDITFKVVASNACCVSGHIEACTAVKKDTVGPTDVVGTDQWWDDVWDLLLLLKLVRQQCTAQLFGKKLSFTNSYLSLQVRRALQQPIRVVTNSLPKWCFRLVDEFAFVLEFETRCHFMYATTSGCSRAIQYLCRSVWKKAVFGEPVLMQPPRSSSGRRRFREPSNRTRASVLEGLSQMVKLPRLKVRVARSRLLQSAMKLITIYGGSKAVIETEFLGEVGTGLGPTTEFFTLVCQQIQSKQLQLWRDDDLIRTEAKQIFDDEQKSLAVEDESDSISKRQSSLAIRGYHRIATYYCTQCEVLRLPVCSLHQQLLTDESKTNKNKQASVDCKTSTLSASVSRRRSGRTSIPQCAKCLGERDWYSAAMLCDCDEARMCTLKWWILSKDEAQYLAKVFPRRSKRVRLPVLQCAHCETVNFPGTDAGIVVMDGDRMVSRSGRRMYERDYRAVTKHVSPLCEGTPLNIMTVVVTRRDVDALVTSLTSTPEVLESEIESFHYLNEAFAGSNVGGGPPVTAPFGLYPKPYLSNDSLDEVKTSVQTKSSETVNLEADAATCNGEEVDVLTWFRFLGRLVGQAILDERLLNLPFARPFLRALRGEKMVGDCVSIETSLSFVDELDPSIANSLRYLHNLTVKYAATKASGHVEASSDVAQWTIEVDALCRSFTMVGADEIPLIVGGEDIPVTLSTLQQYVALNLEFLLDRTIKFQVHAFRQGFEQICGEQLFRFLQAFDVNELEELLSDRGTGSTMWDRNGLDLREHMVCDHGYTAESRAIGHLVSILCELPVDEQRLFVRFVTGANRLPLGGLRNLEPKLTVVRKLPDVNSVEENDAVLPSASTCTNYLKLPDYSTREIMKERLIYCITEGQCSFHLS
ncbi:putative HECT domain, armadillo-like helical, HECT, E3 ligase catalytic domain-containing protein [Plasmopara halstedii]